MTLIGQQDIGAYMMGEIGKQINMDNWTGLFQHQTQTACCNAQQKFLAWYGMAWHGMDNLHGALLPGSHAQPIETPLVYTYRSLWYNRMK